jgi:hypothetical protein
MAALVLCCTACDSCKRAPPPDEREPDASVPPSVPDAMGEGVDIDVDSDRNGTVEDGADEADEAAPVDFLAAKGSLVLVNLDADIAAPPARDFDDTIINGADDELDLSPIHVELERDLADGEHLFLVASNVDDNEPAWIHVMDPRKSAPDQTLVGKTRREIQLDELEVSPGVKLFPGGRRARYDRFLLEGLRFAKEVGVWLEIRRGQQAVARDVVRIRNCPWLANNNTQPLANTAAWRIPGNLINSDGYHFTSAHGAKLIRAGGARSFVQDTAEWGFQVRRQTPPDSARTMIVALRLHDAEDDGHVQNRFLNGQVGVYGLAGDEVYFGPYFGDQGGNLECLPPDATHPFGRLVYGDGATAGLRDFLERQRAQVPALKLPITSLGLAHVDEVLAIVSTNGGWFAAMPDWDLARALLGTAPTDASHGVGNAAGATYGEMLTWLNSDGGAPTNQSYRDQLLALQGAVRGAGARVVPLPGLFLQTGGPPPRQRSFPRSAANCQPTTPGRLVVNEPPDETNAAGAQSESRFLAEWRRLLRAAGVTGVDAEEVPRGWSHGGEAHCVSNVIREPLKR